ncbi:MAG: LysR family transcriptional regulator [Clostridia bacterium]|nr:LysR family transcriptional regulator [Clostridia bacterium]
MNTKQLKYVLVLAREGSFSQAAESLNISQPSLSQYIKKIEQEVGIELFDRSGSRIRLTEAGKVYVSSGQKILELEHHMEQQFSELVGHKLGRIVIGVSPYRSVHYMPQVVAQFQKKYPGMQLVLEEKMGRELLADAESGAFDLCIAPLPINEKHFSYERLWKEDFVLAISREYKKFHEVDESVKDGVLTLQHCAEVDFVMLGETQVMQHVLDNICREHQVELRKTLECRSIETQLAMVKAGVGMAFIPSTVARFVKEDAVQIYKLEEAVTSRDVVVAYRKGKYMTTAERDLIEIMKKTW